MTLLLTRFRRRRTNGKKVVKKNPLNPDAKPFIPKELAPRDPIHDLPVWLNPSSGQKIMFLSTAKNIPVW